MAPRKLHVISLLVFAAFLAVFFWFLNYSGELGHDFVYFFARLHSGQWHFARQGLGIFYFTPHFCGGVPQYGNPQDMYYSLPQFLAIAGMDLWNAAQLSMLFAMILGYFGWYRFGRDMVGLAASWSHVFALIIIANGFYLMHEIAGHLVFFTMPLIGWLLWLVFDRREDTFRSLITKASVFALLSAFIMYSGGYAVALMAFAALVIFLPFELILFPSKSRIKTLAERCLALGASSLLINASKLISVWSFMRFIPREMPFERFAEGSSAIMYMLKAFWVLPQSPELFSSIGMPNRATHEYSLYLSPVVLIGLLCGACLLWRHREVLRQNKLKAVIFASSAIFFFAFFLQLARGHGILVTPLESLPIFKSLHMNMRFLYPFSFLLTAAGVWSLFHFFDSAQDRYSNKPSLCAGILTLASFFFAYYPLIKTGELPRTMPVKVHRELAGEYSNFIDKDVTQMLDLRGGLEELIPVFAGGNHIHCYESLFWETDIFKNNPVSGGAPKVLYDGLFNIYNPACLQYPEENGCRPGDRIKADDSGNAELFLKGQRTSWKIPVWQRAGNWISLLMLVGCAGVVATGCFLRRKLRSGGS